MVFIDTLIINGDFSLDNRGRLITLHNEQELLQRAIIRLMVRKGSFIFDKDMGSELYQLRRSDPKNLERIALGYVQDALYPMTGLSVGEVKCDYDRGNDRITVKVELKLKNNNYLLEVPA